MASTSIPSAEARSGSLSGSDPSVTEKQSASLLMDPRMESDVESNLDLRVLPI